MTGPSPIIVPAGTSDPDPPRDRIADRVHMARAIRLATQGLYTTEPNPRVGCVIVKDGVVVGEGWHRRAGGPHAEPIALAAAGDAARGATAYVSLEPCCHHGRTPPCTDALLAAGVGRVVVAMTDPNPLVAGSGLDRLRAGGVAVDQGLLEAEARRLNPGFIKRMERGLPYVRVKLAASLDGRTAMASGESQWITSAAARRDVQYLRARSSAILTGVGTLLADDPSLNVRLSPTDLPGVGPDEAVRQPLRVVVDSRLRTPPTARLLGLPGQTLIACLDPEADGRSSDNPETHLTAGPHLTPFPTASRDREPDQPISRELDRNDGPHARLEAMRARALRLEAAGAGILRVPPGPRGLDLETLLRYLARMEINEVLIEAGATLAGSALQAGLVDELVLYLAPHLMGDGGLGLFHLPGLERMGDRLALHVQDLRKIGPDLRITAVWGPCVLPPSGSPG